MDNFFISSLKYVIQLIESFLAETFIIVFLLGLLFFLVGLVAITVTIINVFLSPKVNGRVAGAVKATNIKEKFKNGELVKESKEWLYPIFEYSKADGSSHQIRGSSAGSRVLKYKTGQDVRLVINDSRYDHVHTADDIDDRTGLYFGLFFTALGYIIMNGATDTLASLSIGIMAIVIIGVSLLFYVIGNIKKEKEYNRKHKIQKTKEELIIDFNDMRPVEDFIKENAE